MNSRVYQYQNIDGLNELGIGAMWFWLGLTISLYKIFPEVYPPLTGLVGLGVPLLGWSISKLKERITYPRTGYAVPRIPRYLYPVFAGGLLLINTLDAFVWNSSLSSLWTQPLSLGFITACLLLWAGGGLARFYYLAAAAFLLGAGLTWSGVGIYMGIVLHGTLLGLLLMASGGVTLRRYLKEHRVKG